MTERTHDQNEKQQARAERIRRLQERRSNTNGTAAAGGKRRSHRHPAAATRWVLAGASVAAFFTIAGSVAVASHAGLASAQPASVNTTTASTGGGEPTSAMPTPKSTPQSTSQPAPKTVAHTTTRGS